MQGLNPTSIESTAGELELESALANLGLVKQPVDDWLDQVDYDALNRGHYVPSAFALKFMNFIKLVNGDEGEQNLTPVVHLAMLDEIAGSKKRIANLCARGVAKTTLMMEYLFLYIGVFGEIEGFGKIEGMIYVSDSMENGVKSARKNIEFRWNNSEFLQEWLPYTHFTDNYMETKSKHGHILGCKMFGAKALSLNSILYTADGTTTMGECQVGDFIYGPDGKLAEILKKSEIFHKPMYAISLHDGRQLKVSEDHINAVTQMRQQTLGEERGKMYFEDRNLTVPEILQYKLKKGSNCQFWVKATEALEYPVRDFPLDPYTLGVLLGDGRIRPHNGCAEVIAHEDDWPTYEANIPYTLLPERPDKRAPSTIVRTIKGLGPTTKSMGINVHGNIKKIPESYFYGSIVQREALLQGLLDTDGTIGKNGYISFCSNSRALADGVASLVRSLGGLADVRVSGPIAHKVGIKINRPVFRLPRKLSRQKYDRRTMARITGIEPIEIEPSQCIAIDNEDHQYLTNDYTRTHNTGLRGTKIFGKRPVLAVLDDLVSDDDAKSKVSMTAIKDTVYKGINFALDPERRKIIFNGTPFNKGDILYEAVESGGWHVNVWPICEKFPCTRQEFRGAWEDRFTYDFVLEEYQVALAAGTLGAFMQELMLRITSEEERLIQDSEIRWYQRANLIKNMSRFNFYITTDFATKAKQSADFSVISVWAYNANGDWFWVDGTCVKQTMDKNIDDLFRLAQMYKPQSVGVEISGQQGAFISWIQREMMERNIWFNFTTGKNGEAGIQPEAEKMSRFNLVTPLFKAGKMYFPAEMKASKIMGEFMQELTMASITGFKSKNDDCIDTISMLMYLNPWKPSEETPMEEKSDAMWDIEDANQDDATTLSSYIV